MSQLATIQADTEMEGGDYAKNGKIYKELLTDYRQLKKSSGLFTDSLIQAIENRIWLGFINPQTNKFCSFIAHNPDGTIDEQTSFKLWLATGEKQGGMGVRDLAELGDLCSGNPLLLERVFPLISDCGTVAKANLILGDEAEPIQKMSKDKSVFLNALLHAPTIIRSFYYDIGLPQKFIHQCLRELADMEGMEYDDIIAQLEALDADMKKQDLIQAIADIIGVSRIYKVALDFSDPVTSAKKIYERCSDRESIKALIDHLTSLLE